MRLALAAVFALPAALLLTQVLIVSTTAVPVFTDGSQPSCGTLADPSGYTGSTADITERVADYCRTRRVYQGLATAPFALGAVGFTLGAISIVSSRADRT